MRVFVAGATGAIGSRQVPLLVAAGHAVLCLTRSPDKAGARCRAGAKPVIADAGYIRESILKPQAKIVREYAGVEGGMPSYEGVLNDAQVESVILYIKSLKAAAH